MVGGSGGFVGGSKVGEDRITGRKSNSDCATGSV